MNKAYDKAMQRKTVPIFDPQSTIELIRSGEEIQATLDESGKRQLIDRYFEVSENSLLYTEMDCRKPLRLFVVANYCKEN